MNIDTPDITFRVVRSKARLGFPFHDPKMYTRCVSLRERCNSDRVGIHTDKDGLRYAICAKCGANWISGHPQLSAHT